MKRNPRNMLRKLRFCTVEQMKIVLFYALVLTSYAMLVNNERLDPYIFVINWFFVQIFIVCGRKTKFAFG